jgi:hypothetical protein
MIFAKSLYLSAFHPPYVRDERFYKNAAKIANKFVQPKQKMFKTRTIKVSIYSLGWERFIPNEGIFHSQRGNKRRLIFSTCALIIHTFLLSLQKN